MIKIKTDAEIELMRQSASILRETLLIVGELIKPGITTAKLDKVAEEFIRSKGGEPAFKGYQGFPATICASVNEEVVHGIPGTRELVDGDLIGVDCGVIKNGFYSDSTRSFAVGKISPDAERLMKVTKEALDIGLDKVRAGNRVSDISHAIQEYAEGKGYGVVRQLTGHGVGKELHEDPQIPNFGPPGTGPVIKVGMVFAIEPMLNEGVEDIRTLADGWTIITRDGKLSCHFEDTVAVTENGPEILTR
ncbi:type I methionyl aminopeptidase [bacterium]|nr:type I methionyl aminopeptidase [bacterium]